MCDDRTYYMQTDDEKLIINCTPEIVALRIRVAELESVLMRLDLRTMLGAPLEERSAKLDAQRIIEGETHVLGA